MFLLNCFTVTVSSVNCLLIHLIRGTVIRSVRKIGLPVASFAVNAVHSIG